MTYARYLTGVVRALQSDVATSLDDAQAADSLGACVRTLSVMAASMEAAQGDADSPAPPLDQLPPQLASALREERTPGRGLHLATDAPPEDVPASGPRGEAIDAAAQWLRSPDLADDRELDATLHALESWESSMRTSILRRADEIARVVLGESFTNIDEHDLARHLQKQFADPGLEIPAFRIVPGGRSRQTAVFGVAMSDGSSRELVIQRDRPGGALEHGYGIEQQFRLLRTLHDAGVRVARPVLVETDAGVLGAPFIVSERVPGSTVIEPGDGYFAPPPKRPSVALSLARQMAALHRVPTAAVSDILPDAQTSWEDDLDAIAGQWAKLSNGPSLAVESSLHWMRAHVDAVEDRACVVHGDMLIHNVLVDDAGDVTAVLDWEIPRIGHPAEDLGYVRPVIEQMIAWPSFMEAYVEAGGHPVTEVEVDLFTLRALVHMATLAQYGRDVFETGKTEDVRAAEIGAAFLPRLMDRLSRVLLPILAAGTSAAEPARSTAAS